MSAYRKNVSEGVFAYTDEADIDKDKLIVVAYVAQASSRSARPPFGRAACVRGGAGCRAWAWM
jgi:hypothetical protein